MYSIHLYNKPTYVYTACTCIHVSCTYSIYINTHIYQAFTYNIHM